MQGNQQLITLNYKRNGIRDALAGGKLPKQAVLQFHLLRIWPSWPFFRDSGYAVSKKSSLLAISVETVCYATPVDATQPALQNPHHFPFTGASADSRWKAAWGRLIFYSFSPAMASSPGSRLGCQILGFHFFQEQLMPSCPQRNSISRALAGAAVFCLSQTAGALEVAPYFHSWSGSLTEARQAAGMNSAILSFAITNGNCALGSDLLNRLADARNYVAAGGRLMIAFGGTDGVYAEIACKDDNQLFNLMEKLMSDSGIRRFDFDIEGHQLLSAEGNARRARVLARLQAKYPDLYVSLSLPAWLRGFETASLNLLKTTVEAGVRIDLVTVLVQSFGVENLRTMVTPSTVAQASIMGFRAAASQLATIFPGRTQAQLHAMMGISPMIGKNDDGSVFTLGDAQTIADFVKLNGISFISYWSFQRDRAQATNASNDLRSFSGVAQSNYQFHNIFKSADGYVAPASAPAPASAQSPAPAPAAPASQPTSWVQGKQYAAGSIVIYPGGRQYIAKFANPGYDPTISTYFWAAYTAAAAPVAAAPAPAACSASSWAQGRQYAAGSTVSYPDGNLYIANYANPGYNPTISTYYWSRYAC